MKDSLNTAAFRALPYREPGEFFKDRALLRNILDGADDLHGIMYRVYAAAKDLKI